MKTLYWLYWRSGSEWQYLDEYATREEAMAAIASGNPRFYFRIQEVYQPIPKEESDAN